MKKKYLITILALLVAVGIESLPSQVLPEERDIEFTRPLVGKVEQISHTEKAHKQTLPVYCSDYVTRYDWNKTVAHNVMMVESGNNARNLNDNPSTGDYSVGCFQINLLGGNQTAKYNLAVSLGYTGPNTREGLREWLWNPSNNVRLAYTMWKGQGWGPWSFTTCKKVACY